MQTDCDYGDGRSWNIPVVRESHGNYLATPASAAVPVAPPHTQVDVAAVLVKTITDYQVYAGSIEAIDTVEIRPLVPGTIVAVHFKDGIVKKGDSLFTIDPRPYVTEVDRAEGQLAAAQARNGYASTDARRAERLLKDNAIAKRDYDLTQDAARSASAELKTANASPESARIHEHCRASFWPRIPCRTNTGKHCLHGRECAVVDYAGLRIADLRLLRRR